MLDFLSFFLEGLFACVENVKHRFYVCLERDELSFGFREFLSGFHVGVDAPHYDLPLVVNIDLRHLKRRLGYAFGVYDFDLVRSEHERPVLGDEFAESFGYALLSVCEGSFDFIDELAGHYSDALFPVV